MNATNTNATFSAALSELHAATTISEFEAAALAIAPHTNGRYLATMLIMDGARLMRATTTVVQMQLWAVVATVLHEVARTCDADTKKVITEFEETAKTASLLYS